MVNNTTPYVEISVELKHETDKAILICTGKGDDDELWIPRSLLKDGEYLQKNPKFPVITCEVQEWFAHKEGLI